MKMLMSARTVLLAMLLICGMLLIACGDDDDADETTTSESTVTAASGAESPEATATTDAADTEPTATTATDEATSTPETTPTEPVEPTATEAEAEPTEPDDSATEPVTTATTATGGDPTATSSAGVTPTVETEGDPVLVQQLVASMVGPEDLLTGWTFWDTGADDEDEEDNICGIPSLNDEFPPIARAEVSYQASENGPFLSQSLGALSLADAEGGMALLTDAFANCPTWTDPDGVVYTLEELPFPALGDESVTRRVTADSGGFSLIIEVAYIRDRGFVLALAHYGVDEIDSTLTEQAAQAIMDRLAEIESPE